MCVDSKLGNAATYITADVPAWISSHLAVQPHPAGWGVGGFSEGGTCSIQFGAARPDLFGTIIDISGQSVPSNGTLTNTIKVGFSGSKAKYHAAAPANLLKRHAPYHHTVALFSYGALDARYGPQTRLVASEAKAAGMRTQLIVAPASAHDWHTVNFALKASIALVAQRWQLNA
jgi:S-formylglutathione hydrolase FrmB